MAHPEKERNEPMMPLQRHHHARQGTVITSHAQQIKQRVVTHRLHQHLQPDLCVFFVQQPFGKRVVIVNHRANGPVKRKVLPLERVGAAHHSLFHSEVELVVNGRVVAGRQP